MFNLALDCRRTVTPTVDSPIITTSTWAPITCGATNDKSATKKWNVIKKFRIFLVWTPFTYLLPLANIHPVPTRLILGLYANTNC